MEILELKNTIFGVENSLTGCSCTDMMEERQVNLRLRRGHPQGEEQREKN